MPLQRQTHIVSASCMGSTCVNSLLSSVSNHLQFFLLEYLQFITWVVIASRSTCCMNKLPSNRTCWYHKLGRAPCMVLPCSVNLFYVFKPSGNMSVSGVIFGRGRCGMHRCARIEISPYCPISRLSIAHWSADRSANHRSSPPRRSSAPSAFCRVHFLNEDSKTVCLFISLEVS